ncbi:Gmad2 immunoglobulin-like domain-containing protein [Patescibacteria group bacterium]
MEPEQIFSNEKQNNSAATSSSTPPKSPSPKLPFWLWLVIIIALAAVVIIVTFWVADIGGFGDKVLNNVITPVTSVTPTPTAKDLEIMITNPQTGDTIGNPITVTGKGRAFENTIIIRVKDARGGVLAQEFVTTDAMDMDEMGNFSKEIKYAQPSTASGYIEAYEESAASGAETNLFSIGVSFSDWSETAEAGTTNVVFTENVGSELKMYKAENQSVTDYGRIIEHDYGAPVTAKGKMAYVAAGNEEQNKVILSSVDLNSKAKTDLHTFELEGYNGMVPASITVSPLSNALSASIGYIDNNFQQGESPAVYKTYIYDLETGDVQEIYSKESLGIYFVSEVNAWSRANELFIYEFVADAMAAAYGETIKVGVDSQAIQNLYEEYNVSGMSKISPNGKEVAFIDISGGTIEGEGAIVLLDLESGEKQTLYQSSGAEDDTFNILEIGDFNWTADGQSLAWGSSNGQLKILNVETRDIASIDLGEEGTVTEVLPVIGDKLIIDFVPVSGQGSKIIEVDPATSNTSILYSSGDYIDIVGTN